MSEPAVKAKLPKIKAIIRTRPGASQPASQPLSPRVWSQTDSCHHSITISTVPMVLAMFDLDDTLMKVNSTELIMPTIEYAKRCLAEGKHVVVISNQYGITKGLTTHSEVKERFKLLDTALSRGSGLLSYLYAPDKDKYRKPMTGMFDLLCKHVTNPILEQSFYCGDAIGRASDFSVSDLYFAQNCGVTCLGPSSRAGSLEHVVAPAPVAKHQYTNLEPLERFVIKGDHLLQIPNPSEPTLVMMVGPQGAGKSYLSKMIRDQYPKSEFTILNRDTIGSTSKMNNMFHRLVKDRKCIILDNTNYDQAKRQVYISAAPEYHVVIYYFNIPKELCFHMCNMRVQLGGLRIPPVAVNTYYKRLQPPTTAPRIEVVQVNGVCTYSDVPFIPEFYYHYNLHDA